MTQEKNIPTWNYEVFYMDFIRELPHICKRHDSIWLIVDRMTKSSRFLELKSIDSAEDYTKLYINAKVKLYGFSLIIISTIGPMFTFHL